MNRLDQAEDCSDDDCCEDCCYCDDCETEASLVQDDGSFRRLRKESR